MRDAIWTVTLSWSLVSLAGKRCSSRYFTVLAALSSPILSCCFSQGQHYMSWILLTMTSLWWWFAIRAQCFPSCGEAFQACCVEGEGCGDGTASELKAWGESPLEEDVQVGMCELVLWDKISSSLWSVRTCVFVTPTVCHTQQEEPCWSCECLCHISAKWPNIWCLRSCHRSWGSHIYEYFKRKWDVQ